MSSETMKTIKKFIPAALIVAAAALGWWAWTTLRAPPDDAGLTRGNGRIEATEVDVATKLPGRVEAMLVSEGDFVKAGQPLARMLDSSLVAQRAEAMARQQQARYGVAGAQAQVALRESDQQAVQAQVRQREVELDAARRRLARSETLAKEGASSGQELDDDRAKASTADATLAATACCAASLTCVGPSPAGNNVNCRTAGMSAGMAPPIAMHIAGKAR